MDDDIDERIERLLREAEERLRSVSAVQRSGNHDPVAANPLTEEFREVLQSDITQFRYRSVGSPFSHLGLRKPEG